MEIKNNCTSMRNLFLRGIAFAAFATSFLPNLAEVISPSQALQVARQYVQVSRQDRLRIQVLSTQHKKESQKPSPLPYYLFNDARGKGFVLVAGDDAMGQILAYSDEQPLDTLQDNPGVQYLMAAYREYFSAIQHKDLPSSTPSVGLGYFSAKARGKNKNSSKSVVKPVYRMLESLWGQQSPYNLLMPEFTQGKDDLIKAPTGCVATALAQLMYYHKWPEQGNGTKSYTTRTKSLTLAADFSSSHYDWKAMSPRYKATDITSASAKAVSLLMRDAGYACEMDYTINVSSAFSSNAAKALEKRFGYDAVLLRQKKMGKDDFIQTLCEEISNGYPLYLAGSEQGEPVGHAWVVDGYDANGLFHMNFGWNGLANGYYSLYAIAPTATGDELGGKRYNFSYDLEAIIAHPHRNNINTLPAKFRDSRIELSGYENSFFKLKDNAPHVRTKNIPLQLELGVIANYGEDFIGRIGVAVYNQRQQVVQLDWIDEEFSLKHLRAITSPYSFSINLSSLPDGQYTMVPVAQRQQTENENDFVKITNFPTLDIQISDQNLTEYLQNSAEAKFSWEASPTATGELYPGTSATLHCAISNLSSKTYTGKIHLSLLNEKQQEVYIAETQANALSVDAFGIAIVRVPVSIPAHLVPGNYMVSAKVILVPSSAQSAPREIPVESRNGVTPTITISPLPQQQMVVEKIELSQTTNTKQHSQYLSLPCIKLYISTPNQKQLGGRLKMYFEDVETGIRVTVPADFQNENFSYSYNTLVCESNGYLSEEFLVSPNAKYFPIVLHELEDGKQEHIPLRTTLNHKITYFTFRREPPTSQITPIYRPQLHNFFRLRIANSNNYLMDDNYIDDIPQEIQLRSAALNTELENDVKTIFYREDSQIISLATGRALRGKTKETDVQKALSLTPFKDEQGSDFQWVQQDGTLRLRTGNITNPTLSMPFIAERVEVLPINIAQHGYATFFTPVQGRIEKAKAYRAVKEGENQLTLQEIQGEIPANTAFIVEGTPSGQAQFRISASTSDKVASFKESENVLHGSVVVPAQNNSVIFYALSGDEKAFYRLATWQRPFRAFYSDNTANNRLRAISFVFPQPTGVTPTLFSPVTNAPFFDLSGRRVLHSQPGQIVIQNGQKVMQ